ncbi:hypothetical protein [Streptomyces formicae]
MNTSTRNRVVHTIPAGAARLRLLAIGAANTLVPLAVAVAAAWFAEVQLADDLHGVTRIGWLVVVAVIGLSAADSLMHDATERAYRHAYGRIHGPRSWSCEDCGTHITARRWTPYDAAAFEALVSDPAAHDCTAKQ